MKLTKKKAIEISIELWGWLAETGKLKSEWEGWEKYGTMLADCPCCEYVQTRGGCEDCPIAQRYNDCYETAFGGWHRAQTPQTHKECAKLFLAQLREL